VVEASAVRRNDKYRGVILAFGVKSLPDAETEILNSQLKVFSDQIIYSLIDNYLSWVVQEQETEQRAELQSMTALCKFRFMKGFSFRRNDPAVFGVEIIKGKLRQKSNVMNEDGKVIGLIHQVQEEGRTISEAQRGNQVAVSIMGPTIGRQINEGDTLYSLPSDSEIKILNERYAQSFDEEERALLEETIKIRRKSNPGYGY
jgi:translation initiation factor 5B